MTRSPTDFEGFLSIRCLYYRYYVPSTFERGINATKKDDIWLIILEVAHDLRDDFGLK